MRLPVSLCLALMALSACVPEDEPAVTTPTVMAPAGICTAEPVFEAAPLNACATGATLRLAFVGDVLLHKQLQDYGYKYGFDALWSQPAQYLRAADLAIANLEGPVAPGMTEARTRVADPGPVMDNLVYSGFPLFNYHPVVLRDLVAAGVDLVTTANNHVFDRGREGAEATLAELARAGLPAVGSVTREGRREFVHRRATALGTIAFIACTYGTNGFTDARDQVIWCFAEQDRLVALVRREAADPTVAGVIVLPHWGTEYASRQNAGQEHLARALVAAGAMAVIGTHPHAVQPITTETRGDGARALVAYSTGNFVSTQGFEPSAYEAMALLDVCQGGAGRGLVVQRAGWIAMQMRLTTRGYWVDIAPRGATGEAGAAEAHLRRVAPGFAAQPAACAG
jgi:poly-gamma-glutamate synthesis protein (capsule biosynthesis protein)